MSDTGYSTRSVTALSTEQLLEEALQSAYDSGYYAAKPGYTLYADLSKVAIDRRNECFAELRRRLEGANGTPPACAACDSVFQDGEPQRSGDDGQALCDDCYGRQYGARDAEDAAWVRGDAEYDESRLHEERER